MVFNITCSQQQTLTINKEIYSLLFLSSLETTHSELLALCRHQTVYVDLNIQFSISYKHFNVTNTKQRHQTNIIHYSFLV